MSIKTDRQALANVLKTLDPIEGKELKVCDYLPLKAENYLVFIELENIEQGLTFGHIKITWQVTATASARLNPTQSAIFLDEVTNAIIKKVIETNTADLESVEPYFVLVDNTNGASIPASRLTFTSLTTI